MTVLAQPTAAAPGGCRPARDYRDMVIEHLAADEAELRLYVLDLEKDREAYRLLAQVAIERIADITAQNARLQRRISDLLEKIRGKNALRAATSGVAA